MVKYIITEDGIDKLNQYKTINNNIVTLEEKILSVLSNRTPYTTQSIYGCVVNDKAIKTKIVTEGLIRIVLNDLKNKGYVTEFDDSFYSEGGGFIAY